MKKMVKKFLCVVMILSLAMTVIPMSVVTLAAVDNVLLDVNFDSLADGAKNGLSSDEFIHRKYDYSNGTVTSDINTEITSFSKVSIGNATSTEIGNAGNGMSGKAFIYKVNGATANQETKHDFRFAPTVYSSDAYGKTGITTTYEISLRAPSNINGGTQVYEVMVPFGGGYNTMIKLETNTNNVSKISGYTWNASGVKYDLITLCRWTPGQWNTIALTLTPGTDKLDYYLNGKFVASGIAKAPYEYSGGRFRLVHKALVTSGSYTADMAIDNVSIYFGTPESEKYSVDVSSSAYNVDGNTIYLGSNVVDHDTFINNIAVANDGRAEVYTDGTYSTVAAIVTEGCKVVTTSANGKVLGYYTVGGRNIILKCDMEDSYGIAQNAYPNFEGKLVNQNNTGSGSIGSANDFAKYATANVEHAGAGKDGYAYVINAENTTEASVSPAIDFKFIPQIKGGKVTFEASMLAPQNYDEGNVIFHIPYNSTYKKMFSLEYDGKLGINNSYICQWIPGRWYNFAVELTVGSGKADFYLNGSKVLDDVEVHSSLNSNGVIDIIGGRMRFEVMTFAGCSIVTALDDVKVYCGDYDSDINNVSLVSNSEDYDISEYGFVFASDLSVRVNTLKNYISGSFAVYEDDTFETPATYTGEGNLFVVTNEEGNVVKYYTLIPDDTIAMTINDSATDVFSSRETVTIGALARCENANVFAAAYDSEGNLLGVKLADADASSDASVSFNTKNGSYVKLMLWNKVTLKPVGDMVIIRK